MEKSASLKFYGSRQMQDKKSSANAILGSEEVQPEVRRRSSRHIIFAFRTDVDFHWPYVTVVLEVTGLGQPKP